MKPLKKRPISLKTLFPTFEIFTFQPDSFLQNCTLTLTLLKKSLKERKPFQLNRNEMRESIAGVYFVYLNEME